MGWLLNPFLSFFLNHYKICRPVSSHCFKVSIKGNLGPQITDLILQENGLLEELFSGSVPGYKLRKFSYLERKKWWGESPTLGASLYKCGCHQLPTAMETLYAKLAQKEWALQKWTACFTVIEQSPVIRTLIPHLATLLIHSGEVLDAL